MISSKKKKKRLSAFFAKKPLVLQIVGKNHQKKLEQL